MSYAKFIYGRQELYAEMFLALTLRKYVSEVPVAVVLFANHPTLEGLLKQHGNRIINPCRVY